MKTMNLRRRWLIALMASAAGLVPQCALAQDQTEMIAALQRQIDELRAQVQALSATQAAAGAAQPSAPALAAAPAGESPPPATLAAAPASPAQPAPASAPSSASAASPTKAWYEKLRLRGYTQLRVNEMISGDSEAPDGVSRLRSVHDAGVGEKGNFAFRRLRLVVEGDVAERVSIYLQSDFAAPVTNQSNGERREHYVQLRDAYADLHLANRRLKLRFGQSKVPYGWENLQSSSNRLTLDRADAANSAVPSERDLGIVAYYTPSRVQAIWDDLEEDGQKLFGNYGAFGLGVFNGQGTNRMEKNDGLMKVALATWPLRLDGLGEMFQGQVLEVGAQGMLNSVQPEVRSGGVSPVAFDEKRVNVHAVLYPNPLGFQAEWNWGRGPEWDRATQSIATKGLNGGYVQTMYRIKESPVGILTPYARWQRYRGGWKANTNAPRLATDELELGVEWQPIKALELTVAYANMKRAEADERRLGRATGDLIRTQLQWNY